MGFGVTLSPLGLGTNPSEMPSSNLGHDTQMLELVSNKWKAPKKWDCSKL